MTTTTIAQSGAPPFLRDLRANCRNVENPEVFFPKHGKSMRPAKTICDGCELRAECLAWALPITDLIGVWGGTSQRDRERMRAGTWTPPKPTRRPDPTDMDQVAVNRATDGDPLPPLTPADRLAAVNRLTAAGWSALEIARRLQITPRSVQRYRQLAREATES
jgi:hypothetical protein